MQKRPLAVSTPHEELSPHFRAAVGRCTRASEGARRQGNPGAGCMHGCCPQNPPLEPEQSQAASKITGTCKRLRVSALESWSLEPPDQGAALSTKQLLSTLNTRQGWMQTRLLPAMCICERSWGVQCGPGGLKGSQLTLLKYTLVYPTWSSHPLFLLSKSLFNQLMTSWQHCQSWQRLGRRPWEYHLHQRCSHCPLLPPFLPTN